MKAGFGTGVAPEAGEPARSANFIPPPVSDLAELFPQLEILELLGQGGMGAVYRARQPALDRLVALKILPPQLASGKSFAERFMREARALARLTHANIVAVHDFGQAGDFHYLVMEFVDGANLRQIERAGKLGPREALKIIPQICEALQFAHDEGIVHRDIKPENILVDKRGRVKIADFGIAKILGQAGDATLTGAKDVVGTPHYMAPEQVEKPQTVDHRADIYSLGVVFYEMLTGELPLGKFAPPSQKVAVDVRLDEVVLHALEKEPERRYQRASEVKTDVETIASSTAGSSRESRKPASVPVLRWRDRWFWERHVIAFGFVPSAVVLALIPLLVSHWGDRAILVLPLAITGMLVTGLHSWIGHRIRQMKAALPQSEAEVAEAWIAWEHGMWPFNRSQGLAILHQDRLELRPAWHGTTMIIPFSDIISLREVRWMYVPLVWKRGFVLQLANGERIGVAVPEPFAQRWRAPLSRGRLTEMAPHERPGATLELPDFRGFAVIAVIALLLLTAWGNAIAMLVVSAMVLAGGFIVYGRRTLRGGLLVAMAAFGGASVVATGMIVAGLNSKERAHAGASHAEIDSPAGVASAVVPPESANAHDNAIPQAPPVVIRTIPESGVANVDPALSEIRVTFSSPMEDGSWSWSAWGEENFPETTGQPSYSPDGRTCVLPVKLEPGKVYALWLNSEHFHNFTDREGQSAVPYLLIFETRK
jgi:predicted Ser/Thr protein kinase